MPSLLRTRRAAVAALLAATAFAVVHALFTLTWTIQHSVPMAVKWAFDLRNDYGVPAWFTFACTAAAGIACIGLGRRLDRRGPMFAGGLFLFLVLDDATMLHERTGALFAESLSRTGTYAWVIVLGVPFAIAGAWSAWSLFCCLQGHRGARARVLLGFVALGLSILVEAAEEKVTHSGIRWRDVDLLLYTQLVEAWLEMVGPVLIAWGANGAAARSSPRAEPAIATSAAPVATTASPAPEAPEAIEEEVGAGV